MKFNFTIKALIPDPKGKAPRNGPTVDTKVAAENIAFAQMMSWNATDSTGQRFELIGKDDLVAPGAVKLLAIFLVNAEDSAGVVAKFSPFNVLFTQVTDLAAGPNFSYYIGQDWFQTSVLRELLTPTGFNTIGMVLDGKRIKVGRSQGDVWINAKTVTELLAQSGNEQGFVIKNYHPQPVPTLEYRLFATPPDGESMRRARYAAEGKKQIEIKCAVGQYNPGMGQYVYPQVSQNADGSIRRMGEYTATLDKLDIMYAAYRCVNLLGQKRSAQIDQPIPDGFMPYFEVVSRRASPLPSLKSKDTGDFIEGIHYLIVPDNDQDIDDIIRLFYQADNIWHMQAEDTGDQRYAKGGKLEDEYPPVGDIWVSWALGNLKFVQRDDHALTNLTNADYEASVNDGVGGSISIRYIPNLPRTSSALAFRLWMQQDQEKQDKQ